ncbi:hypothetical protein JCM11641_000850 [Rhodosporidiobolus odoratus]
MTPTLPDSLLHSILSLTLPSSHPSAIPSRYSALLDYTKVSKAFARVAQQLLYSDVDLSTPQAAKEFCDAVDDSPSSRRLAFTKTRTLRLSRYDNEERKHWIGPKSTERVLARVPGIKELVIDGLTVDPLSFSLCADLTHLTLIRTNILTSSARTDSGTTSAVPATGAFTWYLPKVTTVTLYLVDFVNQKSYFISLARLLNPVSTPRLSDLAMTYSSETSEPELVHVAPQLERLWLQRETSAVEVRERKASPALLPLDVLRALSPRIQHLAVDIWHMVDFDALSHIGIASASPAASVDGAPDTTAALLLLPTELPSIFTLRVSSPHGTVAERHLLAKLPILPSFETLRILFLRDVSLLPADVVVREAQGRETTREECGKVGIEVYEFFAAPAQEGEGAVEAEVAEWRGTCWMVDRMRAVAAVGQEEEVEEEREEMQREVSAGGDAVGPVQGGSGSGSGN